MYNERLADEQGADREELTALYQSLYEVLENPYHYHDDPKEASKRVEELEFALQRAWNFPEDAKYHRYNYRINGCECPVLDNDDMIGVTCDRWVTQGCPFHS